MKGCSCLVALAERLEAKRIEIKHAESKLANADNKILTSLLDKRFEVRDNRQWAKGVDSCDKWTYKQMQL